MGATKLASSSARHVHSDENFADPQSIAAAGIQIFAEVTECLGAMRTMLSAMDADLDSYAKLSEAGGNESKAIKDLANSAKIAHETLEKSIEMEKTSNTSSEMQTSRNSLHAISRASQTLSAIATLTRATAGSYGLTSLNSYLQDLTFIASAIQKNAKEVHTRLGILFDDRQKMQTHTKGAFDCLGRMVSTIADADRQTSPLLQRERDSARVIVDEANRLRMDSRVQMKGFISVVQFSDRLAQRLDHLATILTHEDPTAQTLAAAQLVSIAEAMKGTAAQCLACANAIDAISRAGSDLFLGSSIAGTIRETLTKRGEAANLISADMESVGNALSETRSSVASVIAANEEAEARFRELEQSAEQVANASINSVLLAARAGPARGALSALYTEVRLVETQCVNGVNGCQSAMHRLGARSAKAHSELLERVDELSEAVASYRLEIRSGSERYDELMSLCHRAGERMDDIIGQVERLRTAMTRVGELADALEVVAQKLRAAGAGASTPDKDVLVDLWNLYTMEEERAVHAETFPDVGTWTQAEASDTTDDIDDLFF